MTKDNSPSKHLMPIDIVRVKDSVFIHLVDPERLDLSRGFLKQSIPDDRPVDQFMPLQDWVDANAGEAKGQKFANTCGIFHVARCGSTLLTQNLKATGQCVMLSEPKFLGQLLHKINQSIGRELYIQSLRTTIAVWQNWAAQQNKRLVIKFSSLAHHQLEDISEILAHSRFVFLFREPVAVLESLTRHSPGFIRKKKARERNRKLAEFDGFTDDTLAFYAAKSYCYVLDKFSGFADPRFVFVDYANLEQHFPAVLKHFGIEIGGTTEETAAQWSADEYAKWKGNAPIKYEPVAVELIEKFERNEAALIAICRQYYEKYLHSASGKGLLQ